MDLPESVLIESLDETIRRSALRLEQEQEDVQGLRAGGALHASAKATLVDECGHSTNSKNTARASTR
jgi:hypothetical protein